MGEGDKAAEGEEAATGIPGGALKEATRRVFFALDPDPASQVFLEHERRVLLSKAWGKRGRFVAPENFHLTLHFCGGQTAATIGALLTSAGEIAAGTARLEIPISGAALFPRASRARAIVCPAAATPPLRSLHRALTAAASGAGVPAARHRFRPHITLARIKSSGRLPNLKTPRDRTALLRPDALKLYASEPSGDGGIYECLGRFELV